MGVHDVCVRLHLVSPQMLSLYLENQSVNVFYDA